ncbi:N-acetylmuramoyl-L-alanine amidase family protein [Anaerosacchariphilus polymeriproducens]|uniref:N-acetylmuramoyl-L-alanine amidase n=1 Tax=Anaerosacchariphilus polymeriproducens TaxID=1812858 RepID=A0A371AXE6_9FIRM|nr:N-acetylmuramoyl-L-alanine amidase [Anaerosacchariphilus polymeriproducens]RDU24211.1 N-acetylmuramoyl-L-alanine amidase [Anaerosacchariphilus polymeriproducens]
MAIKIFIDQGHNPTGYHNAGAQGFGFFEENITFQVGIYLANLLENDYRFEVRLSRPTSTTVLGTTNATSLAERVRMANEWPADYFISIHANSNVNPAINGAEIYIYKYYTQAHWLAQNVMEGILRYTTLKDNGIRENPALYVLRRTQMPAILTEIGYLSNYNDFLVLRDQQWRIAYGMYIGILNYFGFEPL